MPRFLAGRSGIDDEKRIFFFQVGENFEPHGAAVNNGKLRRYFIVLGKVFDGANPGPLIRQKNVANAKNEHILHKKSLKKG